MDQKKIDAMLKQYLQEKAAGKVQSCHRDCPTELELNDYLENRISSEKEKAIIEHLAHCPNCLSLLALAQEQEIKNAQDEPSQQMIERAKNIVQKHPKGLIIKHKWPIFATISFILSFLLRQYFLQFLVLASVFSIKWIFDTGSTRTLIMVYEAWRKKDKNTAQRIIEDFQDKDGLRR
ncbi:MAG: zf-HC2 domain-containing protein [Candidatus Omnitrophica bacterium]|nr:zf-HC2 domain-containing protein [Candidatus Omnitrophota bacterium]